MKLVTYETTVPGESQVGVLLGERVLPASNLLARCGEDPTDGSSMVRFIRLHRDIQKKVEEKAQAVPAGEGLPMSAVRLLAPIPRPGKVLGLGYNYRALCLNENVRMPEHPEVFAKLTTSVTGPFDQIIVPRSVDKVDFEAELGVVIGRPCKEASLETALSFVGGYTVVNDFCAKVLPRPPEAGTIVLSLKAIDTFAPCGPCLLTAGGIDPQDFRILCRVNGEERQNFSSSDMVHTVAEVITYISERITLEPGDIISTGTSLGIGIIQKPPVFLKHGDLVECEIKGIGTISNRMRFLAQS
jgi:2-keto-4-pentenoate hydratase/2-oxohepta-3-ene-1,7-dioic acid hydratase in catechol pathway